MYVFIQGFLYEWFYVLRRRLCVELHDYGCVCVCFTLQHKLAHCHVVLLGGIEVFAVHCHSTNAP